MELPSLKGGAFHVKLLLTGNDEHLVGTLLEVLARAHLVPRNTSTKTRSGMS